MKRLICETVQNEFETSRDQSSTAKMARDNDKYVEKGNETRRTENESKRMSVAMFHDVNVKSEARDNKRLTSKENKGEEALHSKNDKKEMLASIEIKGEVREPE